MSTAISPQQLLTILPLFEEDAFSSSARPCLFSFNSELSVLQAQEAARRSIHTAPWQNKCEFTQYGAMRCSTG